MGLVGEFLRAEQFVRQRIVLERLAVGQTAPPERVWADSWSNVSGPVGIPMEPRDSVQTARTSLSNHPPEGRPRAAENFGARFGFGRKVLRGQSVFSRRFCFLQARGRDYFTRDETA